MKFTRFAAVVFAALCAATCWADQPPVAQPAEGTEQAASDAKPSEDQAKAEKKPEKKVVPLAEQMEAVVKRLGKTFKGKKIIAASVPHYENKKEHWPAGPAVLNQMIATLQKHEVEVPARVEHLILGDLATPPKELIENLQEQFSFDLLVTADYRRTDEEIGVSMRVFDAKTQKRLHLETMDLGNDVDALGYVENRLVWEYCHKMKGYMVGNGECWTLAASALAESNLQHPYAFQYGRAIAMDDLLIPGDLIQIEGVSIQGAEGYYIGMGHHTAIVHNLLGDGMVELIHQNGPPLGRYVCLLPVNINAVASGSLFPYRPMFNAPEESEEAAPETATTTSTE